jgi:hypothetical protein
VDELHSSTVPSSVPGENRPVIGGECGHVDLSSNPQDVEEAARGGVPDANRAVGARRHDAHAIVREPGVEHERFVSREPHRMWC